MMRFRLLESWPNAAVVTYTFGGWLVGVWLMTRPAAAANVIGVLLTAHALICSAYLLHDCAHGSVFAGNRANDRLGAWLSWLNGACIASFQGLKKKHLRHHTDRLDVVTFDYRAPLLAAGWLRRSVLALEWAYVPAVELVMRGLIMAAPFRGGSRGARARVLGILLLRGLFFVGLASLAPKALPLYAIAYLLFLIVLRFMDAFQHTYEVYVSRSLDAAPADPRRDLRYEYEHTYSNLLAVRWAWLNLLVLNFSYHNAHHVRPGVPWYRLSALHRKLFDAHDAQVITCRELLGSFHRHRLTRVLAQDYGAVAATGDRAAGYLGALGVSFLTAI